MGAFAAVAAFALAAGGISAALLVPDAGAGQHNIITAGHLEVQINHQQGSDLKLDNLAPGDHRVAYQLITADMSGVGAADLSMTLFGAADDLFTNSASLRVSFSSPEPETTAIWDGSTCTPSAGFPTSQSVHYAHIAQLAAVQSDAAPTPFGEFTSTNTALCVRFDIGLDQSAGNDVQATSGGFSMSYSLTQTSAVN